MAVASALRPRRVIARTLLLGTSALLAAGLLTWSPTQTTGWSQGAAEGTLWQLLNGARVNNGMAPLQYHATLQGIARWRSADMLSRNYFSHTIPGCGCEVYTYYDANGVNYVWGGENIGWNSGVSDASSPITVHENFMASAGHRANVLNPSFTHGAVGAAAADNQMFLGYVQNTRMYTELFAQVPGAAPAPARAPAPAPSQPRASGGSAPRAAAPAGAAPAAAAPAAQREPEPAKVAVEAPRRPASAAGIDGVAAVVSAPRASFAPRLMIDETAAARAAAMETSDKPASVAMTRGLQVVAAPAETGGLDDVVGALLDFILG